MASFIKLGITALFVLGVVVGNAGVGWAGISCGGAPCTVKIDDLTDTPTVTVFDGSFPASFLISGLSTSGELLQFTLPLSGGIPNESHYSDLFEDHLGGILSDRLVAIVSSDGNSLGVKFASDPNVLDIPANAIHETDQVENGLFQPLFTVSDDLSYTFQVRSDVVETPAPATLLLIGSGLAGLGALGWRRKRG